MAERFPPGTSADKGSSSGLRRRLQPLRARLEGQVASALSGMLRAAGLKLEIKPQATDAAAPVTPPAPVPPPRAAVPPGPLRPFAPEPFVPVAPPEPPAPLKTAPAVPPPALLKAEPARPAPKPAPQGPTPVQVMNAVQNAVAGAVKIVSGTISGVGAARDADSAAVKTAGGAASVASGVATVASGFFPQLAALGIGVPKAPKNRPGMRPQRRVAEIVKNPLGSTPPADPAAPPRPMRRVQRVPMVRAKSSLDLGRRPQAPKPRTYSDMQMRPQVGLTPHEILLKVATIALGKTLLGFLESGARAQQKALQRVSERMSQRQIMLLGMLPAQYIVNRLPQHQVEAAFEPQSARPSSEQADQGPQGPSKTPGTAGGAFKIRY